MKTNQMKNERNQTTGQTPVLRSQWRLMALFALGAIFVSAAIAIDNTSSSVNALVTNGQANPGEAAEATVSHALCDVNGNVKLQVGASGGLFLANGTTPAAGQNTPAIETLSIVASTATWACDPTQNFQEATLTNANASTALAFTGLVSGMRGELLITSGGSSAALTLPSGAKVGGGGSGSITLSTTSGYIDKVTWRYVGTTLYFDAPVLHYN
jgi:hypothetical protein